MPDPKPGNWSVDKYDNLTVVKSPDGQQVVAASPDDSHTHIRVVNGEIVHLDHTKPDGSKVDLTDY